MTFRKSIIQFLLASFLLLLSQQSQAQSLIAGIPSADVAHLGRFEMTHESQIKPNFTKPGWNSFNILCYGLSKTTELTMTYNNLGNAKIPNQALGFGFKTMIPVVKDSHWEPKLGGGLMGGISTVDWSGGYWAYGLSSFRLPGLKTRFTAGLSYGTSQFFGWGTRTSRSPISGDKVEENFRFTPISFMGGIEQPITDKFSLLADWFSGDHDLGALIAGGQYRFSDDFLLISGWKIDNESRDDDALIIELVFNFGGKSHAAHEKLHD